MPPLLQLPPERSGHEAPEDLAKFRQGIAGAIEAGSFRTDPPPEDVELGGVRVLRYKASGDPKGVFVHMHGGGFRMGRAEMPAHFAARLASTCQIDMVSVDYRLAPEHPYPAGLADGYAVMKALFDAGEGPIIASGDSAGGALAAGMVSLALSQSLAPAGLVLFSSWLDLTVSSPCYDYNAATDPLFSRGAAEAAAKLYLQGSSPQDPLASPMFGSVEGFPPTFISVGDGEVLLDDAQRFHAALRAAGAKSTLCVVPGMEHTAVARNATLQGAPETFEALTAFIRNLVK